MGGYSRAEDCLSGGGEMGAAMRAFNWAATPLGPVTGWPQSLRTSVGICLDSRFAILIWWGADLLMLYNDAYTQVLAAKHPAALGCAGRQVWPEIWDTIGPMLHGVIETGNATRSDDLLLLLERNGYAEECYFTFSYSPIRDESGGIGGVFTPVAETTEKVIGERRLRTLRDLATSGTEARSAEAALKLAAETLALNPHDIPFALLYRLDEPGAARLAATAGIQAGGPASPERIGLHGQSAWPVARAARTGEACEVVALVERFGPLPCGAWTDPPHSALVLPVTVPGREAPLAVLVAAVSPRKALDDQYRTFYGLVAGQVTAALSEALAYEQERKRAEALAELNSAKSHFLSNVSHEFRTPLTLMLGPLEDALAGRATGPETLEMVHRNGLRLLKLVNALLDFSRIEGGRVEPDLASVDLATLTAEIASTFRSLMERGGLRFTVDCPPLERPVAVDHEMWEKVVLNLLSNAFKYTPAGEVAVSLRGEGDRVELRVRDTGVGIPEHELARVFERFHRVQGARGRTHEGAGIGLALVHELVKLHGGTVTVTSREGVGSTFAVSLPIAAAPACAAAAPALAGVYVKEAARWAAPGDNVEQHGATGRTHILLADDNADMREYLARLLAPEYEVTAVADGAAALARARESQPDLVLADIMMPVMDGFELLRSLRSTPATAALPVILLSARAGEEARVGGIEAGADDYLVKPFTARELLARIRTHLNMARVRREADAERLRTARLMESMDEAFISLDANWRYTFANQKALELAGKTREEMLGSTLAEILPRFAQNELGRQLRRVLLEQQPLHFEEHDEEMGRWLEVDAYPSDGGVSALIRDITARKLDERRLAEQFARLEAVYTTADAVSRARGLDTICSEALNGLVRAIEVKRLSVVTFDAEGVMRFRAWRGLSEEYRARVEGHTPWPAGTRDASPLLIPDVECDESVASYRAVFAAEGIRAVAFIPMLGQNGVLGRFMLYYDKPHKFEAGEIHVAETIASHVAFAAERKAAEAALREAKTRLQELLDSITEFFIALDRQWRFTYVSRTVLSARGLSAEDVLGRIIWDVFPEAARSEFYPQYHLVMNEGVPVNFEVAWGETWLDVYAHPTPEGMSAYILDVTERKKTEDALRQSEERYRFLAEGLPQFVWIATPEGRTELLNRQWYEYTGIARGRDPAEAWGLAVHPDDQERRREAWRRHSAAGEAYEMEYRLRRASDGRYRWCLSRQQPIRNAAGRIVKWIGAAIDIDDRKRAEEALRESEQRAQRQVIELENLYKTAPVGLCFVDTGLRFLRINEQLAAMHGLAPEAHLGRTLREVAPSLAPVIEPLYERVLESGKPLSQVEAELPGPDGKRIWLVSLVPLVVDGELVGVNKVVQDITARKQFEAQLRQTQKLEAVGILAGGVAHDFNNLLTGILGNASLAAEMLPRNSAVHPLLEELITASERAADLTRQLLAYSGKGRYLIQPVDLSHMVEEISMLVRTSIPRNVEVRLELGDGLPSVEGDAVQIQQLVMNLVINGAEAVGAGRPGLVSIRTGMCGPEIEVRDTVSGETLPAGPYVYVQVEDNGNGMDEATRARIFDPFFTTKFTGRGLGLAAALGIVRGHHGAIQLTTRPGEGTSFLVFFPPAEVAVTDRPAAEAATSRSLAGSGTILVVDDEDVVRGAARSALERYGYRVLAAENGARAVELFRGYADRVDAVLLDVSMPVMDGIETIRRLRAIRPRVPVVVTSGFDEREAMRRFQGEPVDAFLQKPYRAARVAQVIRDALAPRLTRTSAPQ